MKDTVEKIKSFSFCDGQIESVYLDGDSAVLCFQNWQEEKYEFIFRDVVYFKCYNFGCDITEVQIVNQSKEIDEAVEMIKSAGGKAEGYNNFSFYQINFEDCCDIGCVIIFLDVEINKL